MMRLLPPPGLFNLRPAVTIIGGVHTTNSYETDDD